MKDESKPQQVTNVVIRAENQLGKVNDFIDNSKDGLEKLRLTSDSISKTLDNAGNIIDNINNLGNTFLESQRINSQTTLELKKIEENHKTINKNIEFEYKKQKHAMDVANSVVDSGLKSNDLEKIKLGLEHLSGVANHNPVQHLKNALDKNLSENFDDDDFYIEI